MKVTVPNALAIVRLKVTGEKEDFIKCMTEFYRISALVKDIEGEEARKLSDKGKECKKIKEHSEKAK